MGLKSKKNVRQEGVVESSFETSIEYESMKLKAISKDHR